MAERFDIFECQFPNERRFLNWRGAYSSLDVAREKLSLYAMKSSNEFYVKDNATGQVLARANVPETNDVKELI
jgi:hypothetical protein